MQWISRISSNALLLVVIFVALIELRPYFSPGSQVSAQSVKYDYIYVISPMFLYKGQQGLLLMDKRNGNVWFLARGADQMKLHYEDPVLVTQIPLAKLDHAPQ
jgi:hypothetical protein